MNERPRVLEVDETPEHGVWPMPDLPYAQRAILSLLAAGDDVLGDHGCEWPNDVAPPQREHFDNCNCGALVRFANQLASLLGDDPAFAPSAEREAAEAWRRFAEDRDFVVSTTVNALRAKGFV